MEDKTSNHCLRWRRTRSGIVIASNRYPANRVKRGNYKVCEGVFKYQHKAHRFIARIKGADNNWRHLSVFSFPASKTWRSTSSLGFVAVCLWPIAFTVTGLLATVPINLALNTGNNGGIAAANVMGMTYFWLIVAGILVLTGSMAAPWMISRAFLAGSTGISALMVASAAAGASAYRSAVQTASRMIGSIGNGSAPQTPSVRAMDALRPNYASRPITPKNNEASQRK